MQKKPKKLPNLDNFIKKYLRRATLYWPGRTIALQNARVARGKYQCDSCKQLFSSKEVQLDHILPIIPLDGKIKREYNLKRIDWNLWIDRAFPGPGGFSVKCIKCHESKTFLENQQREFYKKEKKIEDKNRKRK